MRVLIVDDDAGNRESTAALIQLKGHETRTASCGPEAIEVVASFSPELVLLDIAMPTMDGLDVARTVRRMPNIEPPVIAALTGYGDAFHRKRCAEVGFDYFLLKPVAANDYDYLIWVSSQTARMREAFRILERKHKADFYAFAISQLDFAWLILNFADGRDEAQKLRSFDKVQRMQERTYKWLKMAAGFTDAQKVALQLKLDALQERLTTIKHGLHL